MATKTSHLIDHVKFPLKSSEVANSSVLNSFLIIRLYNLSLLSAVRHVFIRGNRSR